ncbi:MAG TPA: linear amide C-N hydrolase [Candidatus Aminicenantes bacterium]|nr:linear amide C-N hydrolase [Candidatus Aminicenantes bacterium]
MGEIDRRGSSRSGACRSREWLWLVLAVGFVSVGCKREMSLEDLHELEGVYHVRGEKKPFSGVARKAFANGRMKYLSEFRNGRLEGKSIAWSEDGQRKMEAEFTQGRLNGNLTRWHENGKKMEEARFRNGVPHGDKILWFENGAIRFRGQFLEGNLHGRLTGWDEQGRMRYRIACRQGKPHGEYRTWHANGARKEQGACRQGIPEGIWTRWHANGRMKEEVAFRNGERHGAQVRWHENGGRQFQGEWRAGRPCGEWRAWGEDGWPEDFRNHYLLKGLFPGNPLAGEKTPISGNFRPGTHAGLSLFQEKTLQTLEKIGDSGLYTMEYFGGYGFEEKLAAGLRPWEGDWFWEARNDSDPGHACSAIAGLDISGNRALLGSNMDWRDSMPLILFTHPPGAYASVSMVPADDLVHGGRDIRLAPLPERRALLAAPDFPHSGVNERGLAIASMAIFDGGDTRIDPLKVTLKGSQMIRLVLDYAADVPEAIALFENYNNSSAFGSHYLLADATGRSAIIEYPGGDLDVIRSREPWQVATNFNVGHDDPEKNLRQCWRYQKAYQALKGSRGSVSPPEAMNILKSISSSDGHVTQWSVVYGLAAGDVLLSVARNYGELKKFKIKK